MMKKVFAGVLLGTMIAGSSLVMAEGKKAMISPELLSFNVTHDGEKVEVMRNQNPENKVSELYNTTYRGMPQAMNPFAPHEVETLGEREFTAYMIEAEEDENIMIVDTRTEGWHFRLTIPGSVNYPFTLMKEKDDMEDAMDDFGVAVEGENYDFSAAKMLVMFCNGYWCGQTPAMGRALLAAGYPEEKMKYYRGGMQAWTSLGLTVVGEAAE
ncbi:rhodanese-like domain-containing protein [Amphritea sp.]|uniref:rhodanese-like domain-containing protein n=1 Tax=Amphritea sp. TaxID=1872502 RepID=UPI0025BB9119|nr:rhodanese-like domain-containing protein [Amphritea sp.]